MAPKYVRIGNEIYSIRMVTTINRWHSIGLTNEKIAENLGLTEKEVVDILNMGRR